MITKQDIVKNNPEATVRCLFFERVFCVSPELAFRIFFPILSLNFPKCVLSSLAEANWQSHLQKKQFFYLLYYLLRRCRYLADIYFYDLRYHSYNLGLKWQNSVAIWVSESDIKYRIWKSIWRLFKAEPWRHAACMHYIQGVT